jgi:hypothetical protein
VSSASCVANSRIQLQVGDIVQVKAPAGRFVVDREPGVSTVLIAGGKRPRGRRFRATRFRSRSCFGNSPERWCGTEFVHALLRGAVRESCVTCHAAPTNELHRDLRGNCNQCHTTEHWAPASFEHAVLAKATLERCESCHAAPADTFHRQITAACVQCHSPSALDAVDVQPRSVLLARRRPQHRLRDVPRPERLRALHLLRLPRAHAGEHSCRTRGRGHRKLRQLRLLPSKRRGRRGRTRRRS